MSISAFKINIVLTIDSDADVRRTVSRALKQEGHQVLEAESANHAIDLALKHRPDLIIMDIMLNDASGLDLCMRLRAMPFVDRTPILFLSDFKSAQYAAYALDCGADDYMRKPFEARELRARVRALLRRPHNGHFNNAVTLRFDGERRRVFVNNRLVSLTRTEFVLLQYLCNHHTEHHTASSLLQHLWRLPPGAGDAALVRNHIRNLRRKIEVDPNRPTIIMSSHGRGYTINARVVS